MKNKKADMNVTLMVFMTLIVFTSMLFIFITSQKNIVKNIIHPEIVKEVYLEENLMRFYIFTLSEEALYNTLKKLDKEDKLFEIKIAEEFKKNFENQLDKNNHISSIARLNDKYKNNEVIIFYEEDKINIWIKNFLITKQEFSKTKTMIKLGGIFPLFTYEEKVEQGLGISYTPDINITLRL